MLAGARPEIDDVVGGPYCFFVVLDDDDGVAEVAKARQRGQQLAVVALVQPDRGFVEHIQHAGEVRADLRRQSNALPFSARQRRRASAEREVPDAHVIQEAHAVLDLPQDALGDDRFAVGQLDAVEDAQCLGDRQLDVVGNRAAFHANRQALRLQTAPVTRRTRTKRPVAFQFGLLHPGALVVAAAHVGHDALEFLRAPLPGAEQQDFALLARQLAERHREIDAEITAERLKGFPHQLSSPLFHGAMAPSASDFDSSGTSRAGSKSIIAPRPWQSVHAPCGELNENARGVISGMLNAAVHARQPPRKQPVPIVI